MPDIPKPTKYTDEVTTIKPTTGPKKSWPGSDDKGEYQGSKGKSE